MLLLRGGSSGLTALRGRDSGGGSGRRARQIGRVRGGRRLTRGYGRRGRGRQLLPRRRVIRRRRCNDRGANRPGSTGLGQVKRCSRQGESDDRKRVDNGKRAKVLRREPHLSRKL